MPSLSDLGFSLLLGANSGYMLTKAALQYAAPTISNTVGFYAKRAMWDGTGAILTSAGGALLTGAGALAISHSSNAMAKQTAQSGYLDALIASAAKVTLS